MRRASIAGLALCLLAVLSPATAAEYQIVNGRPADQGAYPWMAAFLFDGEQGCGGSVIAPNWILTAAHCVNDERGQPSVLPDQVQFVVDSNNWRTEGQVLTAAEIISHPGYDAGRTLNDVALVRTHESTDVVPVTLAGPADLALNDPPTVATVIGYGTLYSGGPASDELLEVNVDVVSDTDCANSGYGNGIIAEAMVCAGNPTADSNSPGRDSCQGDSGGPMFGIVNGSPVQFGIVSFGGECGVHAPGVYSQVTTYVDWISGIIGGHIQPGDPDPGEAGDIPTGAEAPPLRISVGDGNDPVANAIAVSQLVFQQGAEFGVLAASAAFPDALGGSSLGFFGPLLYVDANGQMGPDTLSEFQRTVPPDRPIFILGGPAAVSLEAEATLAEVGFEVVRLGGSGRQETAELVARLVNDINLDTLGGTPFDSVIVAYEGNWPDAVAVGQISSWFSIPILLTPTGRLGGPAAAYLNDFRPSNVFVLGGTGVISDAAVGEIEAITGPDTVLRLGGASRLETSALMTAFNRLVLYPSNEEIFGFAYEPTTIVVANLRRDDAFAHLLAAAPLMGNFGTVVAPLEGSGTSVDQVVLDSICAMDADVVALGGPSLVSDAALAQVQAASAGEGCAVG